MSAVRLTKPPHPRTLFDFSSYDSSPTIPPPSGIPASLYTALLHPAVPITIAVIYATTVHYFNSLSNGTPYRIARTRAFKYGVILHNLGLAIYSLWTFTGMSQIVHKNVIDPHLRTYQAEGTTAAVVGFVDSICRIQDRTAGALSAMAKGIASAAYHANFTTTSGSASSPSAAAAVADGSNHLSFDASSGLSGTPRPGLWSAGLAYYGWIFYLSKFYEVVDTMIIILKGRKSSTLQTYHHAGAMLSMWAGIRWMSPPIWIFCWYNSGIHTLMYTYYTLSALGIRVPTAVKRSLTTMQITQFLVGGGSAAMHLIVKYKAAYASGEEGEWVRCLSTQGQELAVVINCLYLTPLTWLFVRFFIRSYLSGSKKEGPGGREKRKVKEHADEKKGYPGVSTAVLASGVDNFSSVAVRGS